MALWEDEDRETAQLNEAEAQGWRKEQSQESPAEANDAKKQEPLSNSSEAARKDSLLADGSPQQPTAQKITKVY